MAKIKVKILLDIPGYNKGQTVTIETDKDGTPLERFWRRRFKDAKADNCLEVEQAPAKTLKIPKSKHQQESKYSEEKAK